MTKSEEMKRLEADMASDKELVKRFYGAVDRIATENKLQSDGELFAAAAAELGYNITAADFERLDAEREELSPDELEKAAGGDVCWADYECMYEYQGSKQDDKGHNGECIAVWHCFTALLHTDPGENKDKTACWKDYACAFINNKWDFEKEHI